MSTKLSGCPQRTRGPTGELAPDRPTWPGTRDPAHVTRHTWPGTRDPAHMTRHMWPGTCDPAHVTRNTWPAHVIGTCDPAHVSGHNKEIQWNWCLYCNWKAAFIVEKSLIEPQILYSFQPSLTQNNFLTWILFQLCCWKCDWRDADIGVPSGQLRTAYHLPQPSSRRLPTQPSHLKLTERLVPVHLSLTLSASRYLIPTTYILSQTLAKRPTQ